jgi:hypothetical protein
VLESFVGQDFLPRGDGIVTRRPLILQLVHTEPDPGTPADKEEWGEFLHDPGRRFYDFGEIRREIEAETERALGKTKKISKQEIRLCIRSPKVLDLTLVDLPGVTKVPIKDQPADIEQQLKALVLEYITRPMSLILAVSAANADIATSDAIQLAKRVDPAGERTMVTPTERRTRTLLAPRAQPADQRETDASRRSLQGVVTKLDLMDAGTDALEVLRGRVVPLREGFVGVVNRSQRDINENTPRAAAREAERAFFEGHPKYAGLGGRCGAAYLARRLNELLLAHVRRCLPEVRAQMDGGLRAARAELASCGETIEPRPRHVATLHRCDLASLHHVGAGVAGTATRWRRTARAAARCCCSCSPPSRRPSARRSTARPTRRGPPLPPAHRTIFCGWQHLLWVAALLWLAALLSVAALRSASSAHWRRCRALSVYGRCTRRGGGRPSCSAARPSGRSSGTTSSASCRHGPIQHSIEHDHCSSSVSKHPMPAP